MKRSGTSEFHPTDQKAWRKWLEKNHEQADSVWLIIYKKSSDTPNLSWSEAVDEALCFGWIDSVKRSIDSEKYTQYFAKRNPKSHWSKINKDKVKQLIDAGLMRKAGLLSIETAKQNGSWTIADSVEALEIPMDLELELEKQNGAMDYFLSLSRSIRKQMLFWVVMAKKPETRKKRVADIATCAGQRSKPKQFA